MPARDIEMMDDVSLVILVHQYARRRRRAEAEPQATLRPIAPGLHSDLHHAFGDRVIVGELRHVPDGVSHIVSRGLKTPDTVLRVSTVLIGRSAGA